MKLSGALALAALGLCSTATAQPLQLDADVIEHVREVRQNHPDRRDDAFAKMGGSSVESKAFLHCFSTEFVDLGEHAELAETIAYFGGEGRSSFNRRSKAAGVSWNLRYVLGGRPAHFREEIADTQARWALVLFGANDAQNENERVYLMRLVYLVEQLEELGVVPILGSALPRRNAHKNRWIQRFNSITQAVAKHWSLPYIDYHEALSALPRLGLARDGVHPNVLPPGGFQRSCQLTERGLRYGNNVRNLLTLQMLDALRRSIDADTNAAADAAADADAGTAAAADAGTAADADTAAAAGTAAGTVPVPVPAPVPAPAAAPAPVPAAVSAAAAVPAPASAPVPPPLPLSFLVPTSDLPPLGTLPPNCGKPKPGALHFHVALELREQTRLRASAFDLDRQKHRVFLIRNDEQQGPRCMRRRTQTLEVDARPGMWDLIVEVAEPAAAGQMLVLIARDPR